MKTKNLWPWCQWKLSDICHIRIHIACFWYFEYSRITKLISTCFTDLPLPPKKISCWSMISVWIFFLLINPHDQCPSFFLMDPWSVFGVFFNFLFILKKNCSSLIIAYIQLSFRHRFWENPTMLQNSRELWHVQEINFVYVPHFLWMSRAMCSYTFGPCHPWPAHRN